MAGDGECWNLGVAVGTVWDGFTIGGFTTGTTLVDGVDGWVIGGNNGFRIGTSSNLDDNGKSGKHGWVVLLYIIFFYLIDKIICFIAIEEERKCIQWLLNDYEDVANGL